MVIGRETAMVVTKMVFVKVDVGPRVPYGVPAGFFFGFSISFALYRRASFGF